MVDDKVCIPTNESKNNEVTNKCINENDNIDLEKLEDFKKNLLNS